MIGQVPPRLGLAVSDPLDKEPGDRLRITFINELDGNAGNGHSTTLTYRTDVLSWRCRGGPHGAAGWRQTGDSAGFPALRVTRACYSFRARVAMNRKLSCRAGS